MEKKVVTAMKKAGKPVKAGEIANVIGVENKEVSKVFQELKKQGKIVSPKRCYYALAD
ncbi:MAG: transcriptional regulator [Deltaproteobacteria bacterium]|nr:MAG: transcriptional regulator [Deltaproteobacteria bacterium]